MCLQSDEALGTVHMDGVVDDNDDGCVLECGCGSRFSIRRRWERVDQICLE